MKHLLVFLILLLAAAPVRAQFLWQRAVGTALRSETATHMIAVAGGFVTAGQSGVISASDNSGLYLSKVNHTGDTLWTKRQLFANVQVFDSRGLIADAAGNLVVSAIVVPPYTPAVPNPPAQGLLVKLTPAGDTIWTRRVTNPAGALLTALVLGNDGSYVAIGAFGGGLNQFPALFKFSPAGALLWTQIVPYDGTQLGYLQNIVAVPGGYFLVSAPIGGNLRAKFITVNEVGTYQFERLVPRGSGTGQLKLNSQGHLLAIGGSLTELTVQGDSLWSYFYRQYNAPLSLRRLAELPTGNYLAAGERYNGPERDVGLVVVDRNGALLRDTLFVRGGSDENVAGVALTPTGNYVVALGTDRGPIGFADQYLFAYRNWNRLLPTRAPQSAAHDGLTAYPNPTADALTLETADLRPLTGQWTLYDMLGRAVQSGTLPGLPRARLSLTAQPAGLYLLRVADAHGRTIQTSRIEKR